jgi:rod shape determining protein RodA
MSIDRRFFSHFNWGLLGITLILFFVGVINLFSASSLKLEDGVRLIPYYKKQILWGMLGFFGFLFFLSIDYRKFKQMVVPLYLVSIFLLILVLLIGKSNGGARRWLHLGFFSFQPTELVKLSIIVWVANFLSELKGAIGWREFFKIMMVVFIPVGLIVKQPDLGSGLNILMLVGGMMLFFGINKRVLVILFIIIPILCPIVWNHMHDYQKNRVRVLFNPEKYRLKEGYNIIQSQIAVGSGRFWGKGFMEGTQSQLRFLPEKHTDFVFAVFAEEWGFVGSICLLILCCIFLYQISKVVEQSKDSFGAYIAVGVFFYFFWQFFINISMVLGILPVVGIPLPFLSYGGSSIIVNFCLLGLVSNVSMRRFIFKEGFS